MYRHKLFNFLIFILISFIGYSQTKTISGIVKDGNDGSLLPGVTVQIKGPTLRGTQTDGDGAFSINTAVGDSLLFTYMGKVPQTRVVGTANVIAVELFDDATTLDEVTVVAFGTQKKESVVASIQTVKISDLRISSPNLGAALAGAIPGLISYQTSGEPGADNANFFVRGVTTFGYKATPLILVDGFEVTDEAFARLQVDDIESFSILKDASASVLYGSRASNGIIIVTTKKGFEGPVQLSIRVDNHIATPTKIPKLADGITFMNMYNDARMTRNPLLGPYYSAQKIQATKDNVDPMIFPNVDWYGEIFKNQTFNTKANINVQGGGQVATYYVAGGLDHETGLLKVDPRNNFNTNISINRSHIRSNVIFKLTPTTSLNTMVSGRFERQVRPQSPTTDVFRYVMNSNPVDFPAIYEPDEARKYVTHTMFGGTFVEGPRKINPFAELTRGYSNINESDILAQAVLIQDLKFITEGLKVQVKASVNNWTYYRATRRYDPYYYDLESYNMITGDYKLWCLNPTNNSAFLGNVDAFRDANFRTYFEGRMNYGRQFAKHNIGAMFVATAEEKLLTSGTSSSLYETLPERNTGLAGRLTYDFDSRFFAEISFGYNGSEKFGTGKRFGFYPAIAGGWIISNESFFLPLRKYVNMFKLKGSYGKIGNDAIARRQDRFFFLSDIAIQGDAWGSGYRWGDSFMNSYGGYTINRYANPDITWEVTDDWNTGVELEFFKDGRLKVQAETFGKYTRQIYVRRENFPASAGLEANVSGNVGELKSWGYEGSIDYSHWFNKNVWVQARANLTYVDNKYMKLDERDYRDAYRKRVGYNKDQQWGLIAERLFVDQQEIFNSPPQSWGEYLAGDIKYKDINDDKKVDDNDQVPIGYPTSPKMQYGFGPSIGYHNWDFSFFFQGNAMISIFIDPTGNAAVDNDSSIGPFIARRNALEIVARDYWSETNPNVYAFWPRLSTTDVVNNTRRSTWWMRDGSFMRLKRIELGYTIKGWDVITLKSARVYVMLENILTFSKFKLWDPERRANGIGYPPNIRYNVGLKFDF